jgi:hypothetical protein
MECRQTQMVVKFEPQDLARFVQLGARSLPQPNLQLVGGFKEVLFATIFGMIPIDLWYFPWYFPAA